MKCIGLMIKCKDNWYIDKVKIIGLIIKCVNIIDNWSNNKV